MSKKDLQYYLDHPDEMPTDTKEIEALASEQLASAEEQSTKELSVEEPQPEKAAEPEKPEAKPEAKAEEPKAEAEKPAEEKPPVLLAKDGRKRIPYSVLESARERAQTAEAIAAEQAKEIARLKSEKTVAEKPTETLTEDELNSLAEGSPELAKVLRSYQETMRSMNETITALTTRQAQEDAQANAEVQAEVQEAVDSMPTLLAWQTDADKTLWNEASRIDKILRGSPRFKDVSFADRFKVVGRMVCETMGIEQVPEDFLDPPADKPAETKVAETKPKLTDEEIRAAAEAKLKDKAKAVPKSLSDIPGGAPPHVDEKDRVESMSAAELGSKLMSFKSADEINAYLATL